MKEEKFLRKKIVEKKTKVNKKNSDDYKLCP